MHLQCFGAGTVPTTGLCDVLPELRHVRAFAADKRRRKQNQAHEHSPAVWKATHSTTSIKFHFRERALDLLRPTDYIYKTGERLHSRWVKDGLLGRTKCSKLYFVRSLTSLFQNVSVAWVDCPPPSPPFLLCLSFSFCGKATLHCRVARQKPINFSISPI